MAPERLSESDPSFVLTDEELARAFENPMRVIMENVCDMNAPIQPFAGFVNFHLLAGNEMKDDEGMARFNEEVLPWRKDRSVDCPLLEHDDALQTYAHLCAQLKHWEMLAKMDLKKGSATPNDLMHQNFILRSAVWKGELGIAMDFAFKQVNLMQLWESHEVEKDRLPLKMWLQECLHFLSYALRSEEANAQFIKCLQEEVRSIVSMIGEETLPMLLVGSMPYNVGSIVRCLQDIKTHDPKKYDACIEALEQAAAEATTQRPVTSEWYNIVDRCLLHKQVPFVKRLSEDTTKVVKDVIDMEATERRFKSDLKREIQMQRDFIANILHVLRANEPGKGELVLDRMLQTAGANPEIQKLIEASQTGQAGKISAIFKKLPPPSDMAGALKKNRLPSSLMASHDLRLLARLLGSPWGSVVLIKHWRKAAAEALRQSITKEWRPQDPIKKDFLSRHLHIEDEKMMYAHDLSPFTMLLPKLIGADQAQKFQGRYREMHEDSVVGMMGDWKIRWVPWMLKTRPEVGDRFLTGVNAMLLSEEREVAEYIVREGFNVISDVGAPLENGGGYNQPQPSLADGMDADGHKRRLEELRKSRDVSMIAAEEMCILAKAFAAVRSVPLGNFPEDTDDKRHPKRATNLFATQFPRDIRTNCEVSCFSSIWLLASVLLRAGIKPSQMKLIHEMQVGNFRGDHFSLLFINEDKQMCVADMGVKSLHFLPFHYVEEDSQESFTQVLKGDARHSDILHTKEYASGLPDQFRVLDLVDGIAANHSQNVGMQLLSEGDLKGARHALRLALAFDPEHSTIFSNLAVVSSLLGKESESVELCRYALELYGDHPQANFLFARLLAKSGDAKGAAEHLRRILADSRPLWNAPHLIHDAKRMLKYAKHPKVLQAYAVKQMAQEKLAFIED